MRCSFVGEVSVFVFVLMSEREGGLSWDRTADDDEGGGLTMQQAPVGGSRVPFVGDL